ncbi:hypothetical protein C0J52_21141 [Blattella germanica]|nr:hypothetical protein C0J52_21141 [Blattella germanica]
MINVMELCFGLPQGAVSLVLDSLDDIHCLQEAPLNDRDFLHSVLEDRQLHALLEHRKSSTLSSFKALTFPPDSLYR